MEWRAEGIVLGIRRHGEHAAIVDLFTAEHRRHFGVVRGGASRKMARYRLRTRSAVAAREATDIAPTVRAEGGGAVATRRTA